MLLVATTRMAGRNTNGVLREKSKSKPHAIPKCDQWSGNIALNQTSQILLVSEQGLGDTLQFIRYANTLKKKEYQFPFAHRKSFTH